MKLSIVIVNYNVKFFLEQCLISVAKAIEKIEAEVIIVDNNSIDGSIKMLKEKFPQVHLIENNENFGFSKANNQAIKECKGEYILLLNPDTLLEDDTLKKILAFADETPDAGGIGVKMIDGKGRFLPESKRSLPTPDIAFYKIFGLAKLFPNSKTFGKYHLTFLDENEINEVDILSGAFMLLRKSVIIKTGLLDETFFMYGEDIDLSYRIKKAGFKNYYFPKTRIIHYKGESTKKSSVNYVFVFYKAMIIFAQKHFSKNNAKIFSLIINTAIYIRALVAILSRFFRSVFFPIIDFILIFSGIIFIKNFWQHTMFYQDIGYYPTIFVTTVVPVYILIWILSVFLIGGYEKPVNLWKLFQGIAIGTLIILVIYALLPESFRFSRALILLGALWSVISMVLIRLLLHLTKLKGFKIGSKSLRIAIIGSKSESERISLLLNQFSKNPEFMGFINCDDKGNIDNNSLGHFEQLKEIIDIYKLNELIFCAKDLPYDKIIDKMSELHSFDINFKIVPPESIFIVGSNSIESPDSFWAININSISKIANLRKKYALDIVLAIFFLLLSPLLTAFVKNKIAFFSNIFDVFSFKKTWVSYNSSLNNQKLPKIRNGILSPDNLFKNIKFTPELIEKINLMYARNYKLRNDLAIILKNISKLGN